MPDEKKTQDKFITEPMELREQISGSARLENERKRADAPLKEGEEKYRRIVEMTNQGICIIDTEMVITFVNKSLAGMLGYSPEEMIGRSVSDFMDESGTAASLKKMEMQRRGISESFEMKITRKDETPIWVIINAVPYYDKDGNFSGSYAMLTDITERKRAEQALHDNEVKYRIVADNTYDWEFWLSPDGQNLYTSPSCERVTGYAVSEFIKNPGLLFDITHPEDRPAFEAHKHIQRAFHCELEFRIIAKNGDVKWIHHICQPIYDESGCFIGTRGSNRDITQRKQAEDALKKSETNLDRAQRIAALGNWEWDLKTNMLSGSREYYRIFGLEQEYGMPVPFERFACMLHPDDLKWVKEAAKDVHYDQMPGRFEFRILLHGEERHLYSEVEVILDETGQPVKVFGTMQDITERKRAEEAMRRNEQMLKQSQGIAQLGSWELDLTTNTLSWSDEVYRIFGLQPQEFGATYEAFLEAVYPDDRDAVDTSYWGSIREGRDTYEIEHRIVRRSNGELRIVHEKCEHFRDASGRVIRSVGMIHDITERKRAEEEVRLAYAYNRSLIEASLDPLVTIAPDGKIMDVNLATEKVTGYPREKLIGTDFSSYFTDPEKAKEGYLKVFKEGSVTDYPLEIRNVKGRITPVIYNSTIYRDESGKAIGVFAAARDITERKRAEMALKESEGFLNNIFRSFQDGISVLDPDLNILRVNPIMERWYGEGLLGKKCYQVYHGRKKPCERCPSIRAIHEKTMQKEIIYDNHGWTELYVFPMIDDKGEVTGIIEHVRDINERKRSEEALEDAKNQAEIYLDLMGHDINNLNQAGIGYLELALDTLELDQKERELLAKPLEALENSSKLIDKVRKIQQVKTGERKLYEIDVTQMLHELIPKFTNIHGREVTINFVSGCHCFVSANDLLGDVFSNIIGNAVKHSSGPLTINVRLSKAEAADKAYCKVTIEDDGPGIPDNVKKKLFSRFQRGNTKASGKGLGLYLVRSLVQYYDGYVWIEDSVPGDHTKGTRFVVMLPDIEDSMSDEFHKKKSQ